MGSYCLMNIEFQFFKLEKSSGVEGGAGCTTMRMYLKLLTHTLKSH